MVHTLRSTAQPGAIRIAAVAGKLAVLATLGLGWAASAAAQGQDVHYLHHGIMPPGAIGSRQLLRGGPLPGFFQPVEIKAPGGCLVSIAKGGDFAEAQPAPLGAGMLIGQVYRLRVANLPLQPGVEVFPSIEVIDRLYAPEGQQLRFPIIVELTKEDLELAASGKFVTRVIYLEDPRKALPAQTAGMTQPWFETKPGEDPLAVADALGRPVAILRMGGRLPEQGEGFDAGFLFGCPPYQEFPREVKVLPAPPDRTARRASR